jgi:F-type H+-transporting ATPase subunit b
MLIDWFTVAAQTINFLILVWLLKRFLYAPILAAIDARETKIAAELKDAAANKAQAQSERDDFRSKSEALERRRAELLREATDHAHAERQRLLDAARKDADALRAKLQAAVGSERLEAGRELVTRTQQEVFAVARKALADLAGTTLEDRIAEVFIGRLHEMRAKCNVAPGTASRPTSALVRSAFELPPPGRTAMENAVRAWLGTETRVTFETVPELISGIELTAGGQKLAWSISDFLTALAESATALLETQPAAASATAIEVPHAA